MGAKVQGHPIRAKPYEGISKRPCSPGAQAQFLDLNCSKRQNSLEGQVATKPCSSRAQAAQFFIA